MLQTLGRPTRGCPCWAGTYYCYFNRQCGPSGCRNGDRCWSDGRVRSHQTLCRRLKVGDDDRHRYTDELRRLANELAYWPLALELASGYMDTCGIQLEDVSYYLNELKVRSLADPDSLPPIYPRTLVAAISLCLEQLRGRIGKGGEAGYRAYLASEMITYAAFLASRQLPCHMLAAAVIVDPELKTGPRIWVVLPSIANMAEVVRELRRFSLASFDQDLPAMENTVIDDDRTMTINTVVQEVIRAEVEGRSDTYNGLNCLANQVERWLTTALELNILERASALFSHAEILAGHLRRLAVVGKYTALLYGNLAGAYWARGETSKAEEFLRAELGITESSKVDHVLAVQTKIQFVGIYFDDPDAASITLETALAYLEDVTQSAADISLTFPNAAIKFALDIKRILDQPRAKAANSPELASIKNRLSEIVAQIGPTDYSDALLAIRKANALISKGRLGMAERLCIRALDSGAITATAELEARRFLVESLVGQCKWQEAWQAHNVFRQHFGPTRFHMSIITGYAHNVGHACATLALTEGAVDAIPLLQDILEWPIISDAIAQPSPGWKSRLRVLAGIVELFHADYQQAEATLTSVRPADLIEEASEQNKGWCVLWQIARLAAFRAVSARYMLTSQ